MHKKLQKIKILIKLCSHNGHNLQGQLKLIIHIHLLLLPADFRHNIHLRSQFREFTVNTLWTEAGVGPRVSTMTEQNPDTICKCLF